MVLIGLWAIIAAVPARAVTISGILVYSTDDFGNPNGYETFASGVFQAQAWATLVRAGQPYHGLAVASGLPPTSIDTALLNFPNFSVDLPLDEGENYFTFFVEPGDLTATDDYQRFLINLYFDGEIETPGITVLFPRYAEPDGSAVAEARPNDDQMYAIALPQQASGAQPHTYYDDGIYRVSILRASMLSPERASLSVDRVSKFAMSPSDVSDWVGTLTVAVAPSESFGAGGPAAPFGSTTGSGGGGGTGGSGGNIQPRAGSAGYLPPPVGGQPQPVQGNAGDNASAGGGRESATPREFWHKGGEQKADKDDATAPTPTPEDVAGALRDWLKEEAALTQTPATTGTPGSTGTPAPSLTPGSKTPGTQTKTPLPGTPTPALTGTQSPVPKAEQNVDGTQKTDG